MNGLILALFDASAELLGTWFGNRFVEALVRRIGDDAETRADVAAALPAEPAAARLLAYEVIRDVAACSLMAAKHWDEGAVVAAGGAPDVGAWTAPGRQELERLCEGDDQWWFAVALACRHACAGAKKFASLRRDDCERSPQTALAALLPLLASSPGEVERDREVLRAIFGRWAVYATPGARRHTIEVRELDVPALRSGERRALLLPLSEWYEPGDELICTCDGAPVVRRRVSHVERLRGDGKPWALVSLGETTDAPELVPFVPDDVVEAAEALFEAWAEVDVGDPRQLVERVGAAVRRVQEAVRAERRGAAS